MGRQSTGPTQTQRLELLLSPFRQPTSAIIRVAIALTILLPVIPGSTPALAQTDPPSDRLPIGDWSGMAHASGPATASSGGLSFLWTGEISGYLDFVVSDDYVDGSWLHTGLASVLITGTTESGDTSLQSDFTINGTDGVVTGTPSQLTLTGVTRQTGTNTVTSSRGTFSLPIDRTLPLPALNVDIAWSSCDEAYGNWTWSIEQTFENHHFSATLRGVFFAEREETGFQEQLDQLLESIGTEEEVPDEVRSPLFLLIAEYITFANSFIDAWPEWTMDEVMDALSWAEHLLNQLRNLRECEQKFFGEENVEQYANALTFLVQQLIGGATSAEDLSGEDLFQLMEVAGRVGALGPGAPNPAEAERAEEALRLAAQGVLEDNLDPSDNRIFFNEDTQKAMLAGAIMDWTFMVGGEEYIARERYARNGLDWQQEARESEGGE